jgi:ABC-type sulfate/molybdate transport systems ATPase subunit
VVATKANAHDASHEPANTLQVAFTHRLGSFELAPQFQAEAGITALVGASGAGKTLTLRAIAGLLTPQAGRIALQGDTLFDAARGANTPPQVRRIGVVFQQYALFPHLTVAANVAYGLAAKSDVERQADVNRWLTLVGLESYGARWPRELSGGQQQRVALARALAPAPRMLLLDEPFAAVDVGLRKRLREELRRIQQTVGTPMLLVTHDLDEVRQIADHVIVMDAGRVVHQQPVNSPDVDLASVLAILERPDDSPRPSP